MTVTAGGAAFAGAGCAIAGSTPRAAALARELAEALAMVPFEVADADRAAYHAAASLASNFLVTLEDAAERLAATAGVPRAALVPLVRASLENWATAGGPAALTGPIARGDGETVARQREALAARTPGFLPAFDALAGATRALAQRDARPALDGEPAPALRTVRTVEDLRALLAPERRAGRSIGLVPTMGALHPGHLALVRRARAEQDVVVVSLFVNPAQFDEAADLAAYPRTEAADAELAQAAGADILFAPAAAEVYPPGFATTVHVGGPLTETLEGAQRGIGHFDGVATVVTKLLAMCAPDAAYFGAKDAQQALVVQRLVRDLNLPARIVVVPTVRDADGLALSSRNGRLDAGGLRRALALSQALQAAAGAIETGDLRDGAAIAEHGLATLRAHGADPEYFAAVDPDTLAPAGVLGDTVLLLTAARVGDVRLIDNLLVPVPSAPPRGSSDRDPDPRAVTGRGPASTIAS